MEFHKMINLQNVEKNLIKLQDMMQRNLSCRNSKESQKNMIVSMVLQFVVISIFLMLMAMLSPLAMNAYNYQVQVGDGTSGQNFAPINIYYNYHIHSCKYFIQK